MNFDRHADQNNLKTVIISDNAQWRTWQFHI